MCSISDTLNTNATRKYVLYIRYTQHKYPQETSAMYQIHLTQMSPGNVQYIRYTQHKCPHEMCSILDTLNTNVPRKCAVYQIHSTQMSPGNVLRIRHTQDKCPQGKLYDASDTFNTKVPRETSQGSVLFIRYMLHASDGYGPSTQSRVIRRLQKTCH